MHLQVGKSLGFADRIFGECNTLKLWPFYKFVKD